MKAIYIKRRIMVITILLGLTWGAFALLKQDNITCDIPVVRAQAGDTMWDLGYRHCPNGRQQMGDTMQVLIDMNNGDSTIHVGQMVVFPWKEEK